MISAWLYGTVAFALAAIAFLLGQIAPGAGVVFMALSSTIWTAYSANRQRRFNRSC